MDREHCPECGHLLSKNRSECHFCGWDERFDEYSYSFMLENHLAYHDPSEWRPDQQPGF